MIPLSVSEISALDNFCDEDEQDEDKEEELGILVVGFGSNSTEFSINENMLWC